MLRLVLCYEIIASRLLEFRAARYTKHHRVQTATTSGETDLHVQVAYTFIDNDPGKLTEGSSLTTGPDSVSTSLQAEQIRYCTHEHIPQIYVLRAYLGSLGAEVSVQIKRVEECYFKPWLPNSSVEPFGRLITISFHEVARSAQMIQRSQFWPHGLC